MKSHNYLLDRFERSRALKIASQGKCPDSWNITKISQWFFQNSHNMNKRSHKKHNNSIMIEKCSHVYSVRSQR